MLVNSSGIRQTVSLTLPECLMLTQLTYNPNRIRNYDNFMHLLQRFTLISKISDTKSKFRELIYSLRVARYERGDMVFHRPNVERSFGLVLYGSVSVYGHQHAGLRGNQATEIRTLRGNSYFGHTMEMDGFQVSYIKAEETTFILHLTTKMMYRVLDGVLMFPEITQKYNFYKKLVVLKDLEKKRILKMVEVTEKRIFSIGNIIFQENTEPQYLYIIVFGQVALYKKRGRSEIPVSIIGRLELLGLEEILGHKKYEFSAKAKDQTNILVQIPKQAVLDAFDQLPFPRKNFETKSKLRQSRFQTAAHNYQERIQERPINTRASFRQKRRFHTELPDYTRSNAVQSRLRRLRKTSYLTNKPQPFFENQQDFYQSKLKKFDTIIRDRYGATYGQQFFNIFEGYDLDRQAKPKRPTYTQSPSITDMYFKKQKDFESTKISTKDHTKWQFRSHSSQQNESSEFLITQQARKMDIFDPRRRNSDKLQF